ncbi:putative exoglucanase gh6d [Arachnomyces sp. PD_36]|nr:putative exoglucanase gh6d [Arachnomyces sp. PD_36]
MRSDITILAALAAAGVTSALPHISRRQDANPFEGRQLFVNPTYSESLEVTKQSFSGNATNAGKVQFIQNEVGTFVWVSNIDSLANIDAAIEAARSAQESTGTEQIVGLVLYNLPDRDCSAGESSGELTVAEGGVDRYKTEYVDVYASKVLEASDLQFAIIMEPDAVANMITGKDIPLCSSAADAQRECIAYAIDKLQADNVHLYLDAANGGWLGSADMITAAATEFANIIGQTSGSIRGFSTNVSNYNPFSAETPDPVTDGSQSYDESHYVSNLAPALEGAGLPSRFIIDQSRVALPGARSDWGEWCNVEPAGFGQPATTQTDNANVDSIVWAKPGGESDGECGMAGAPAAGSWFDAFAQMLIVNAHPDVKSVAVE